MSRRSLSIERTTAALAATAQSIAALTAGVEPAQLRRVSGPGEWSALDVLAHLRACADVWGGCILRIVREESPTIRAVNPRSWIKETGYAGIDFGVSRKAFASQRADLLAVLEPLPRDAWSRRATVTGAGRPLERTVLFYAEWMAVHERPHVKQIGRIVAVVRSPGPPR